MNGQVATGTVQVYRESDVEFIIRLADLSVTTESGLELIPTVDGVRGSPVSLRSSHGTANYDIVLDTPPTVISQVSIYSTVNQVDYAQVRF